MKETINLGIYGFKPKGTVEVDTELVNIKYLNIIYESETIIDIEIVFEPVYFNKECILELARVVSSLKINQTPYIQLRVGYNLDSALDRVKNMKTKDNKGWTYDELMAERKWQDTESLGLGVSFHEKDGKWHDPDEATVFSRNGTPTLFDIVRNSLIYSVYAAVKSAEREKNYAGRGNVTI